MGDIKRLVQARINKSIIHVGDMPRGVRVLVLLGYAVVFLLFVATLYFTRLGISMPPRACEHGGVLWLCFAQGDNVLWSTSIPALLTSALAFVLGWAFVLTGASDCRPFIFLPIVGLFVLQLFFLPGGLDSDVVRRGWGFALLLMIIPVGMYIFSHRLRYWRALPLLEFAAWFLIILSFAGFLLFAGNIAIAGGALINVFANSRIVLDTLWFLLALQTADLAVALSRLVVTRLRRWLTEETFGRLVIVILLVRPVISMAMLFLTKNDFWLTDYMVSLLLLGFALRLGVGGRPLAGKPGILLLFLLSLSALAFPIILPGAWLGRFYFVFVPLILATVWLVLERHLLVRTAATLLALSLAWPVVVLALTLAFSGQGDFVEAVAETLISALGFVSASALLFVGLAVYNLSSTGVKFVNTAGRAAPRTGRALLYFGAIITVTGLFMFSATLRDAVTGVSNESLQAELNMWFAFGTFFLAAPYLAWTTCWYRERLIGGEESSSVGWGPSGSWIVIGVLFGVLATRLLVWEFGLNPLLGVGIIIGTGIIVTIAARARGVNLVNIIVGGVGSIAGMIAFFLIHLLGQV